MSDKKIEKAVDEILGEARFTGGKGEQELVEVILEDLLLMGTSGESRDNLWHSVFDALSPDQFGLTDSQARNLFRNVLNRILEPGVSNKMAKAIARMI